MLQLQRDIQQLTEEKCDYQTQMEKITEKSKLLQQELMQKVAKFRLYNIYIYIYIYMYKNNLKNYEFKIGVRIGHCNKK